MKKIKELRIDTVLELVKKERFTKKLLAFTNIETENRKFKNNLNSINLIFSYLLIKKRPDLVQHTPYPIRISGLVAKNEWTQGHYVALDQPDGSLDLQLSFSKIAELGKFPVYRLVWVIFHEFRHRIQVRSEVISSVIRYPNWANFNLFMQREYGQSQDKIDHIFHELNPAEVDAHIFACEMTGIVHSGTAFDINDEKLNLLKK